MWTGDTFLVDSRYIGVVVRRMRKKGYLFYIITFVKMKKCRCGCLLWDLSWNKEDEVKVSRPKRH